jgi:lipopolysaccharide/colanic/teichoic acid biosynthesis glycosyltransferase
MGWGAEYDVDVAAAESTLLLQPGFAESLPLRVAPLEGQADSPARDDSVLANPLDRAERAVKRGIDLLVAVPLLLLSLPLLILAALAVKLDSHGPVFFCHDRVGMGRHHFRCYKLRTMTGSDDDDAHRAYVAAMIRCQASPENGLYKRASNPRITRVGRVLRRLSVDELPQLWNVVKGDMSMVGPRPPVLTEAAEYGAEDWQRLRVKPGITGLAQLRGRSALRFDEIVAADIEYAERWTPLLDIAILARTPLVVVSGRGVA